MLYCYCCNVGSRNSVGLLKLSHICITATVLVNMLDGDDEFTKHWLLFTKLSCFSYMLFTVGLQLCR